MTGSISNREFSRTMIDSLKERVRDRGELRKALRKKYPDRNVLSDEGLRKRVERYLPKFEDLDLVELRDGKYCWKNDGFKGFEDAEEKNAHSRMMIPALRKMAGITEPRYTMDQQAEYVSEEDMRILVSCTEDHLRSCKDVWVLIENYRRKYSEFEHMSDIFNKDLLVKLKKEFSDPIVDPFKKSKPHIFIANNLPSLINNHILWDSTKQVKLKGEKIFLGESIIAKGPHLLIRIREFVNREADDKSNIEAIRRIEGTLKEAIKMKPLIEYEIRKIIIRIKTGYWLPGGCEICVSDL